MGDDNGSVRRPQTPAACRLHAILARDGRSAVILRRGPRKFVQLIRWWLKSDTFECGQWLRGRIYEHRCDLSPTGEKFVYFAQNFSRTFGTWTAISRPPWFTALALWPKGDCWGGGGLMDGENILHLNHPAGTEANLHPDFALPNHFRVLPLGQCSGSGEDDPISYYRLIRDGWMVLQEGRSTHQSNNKIMSFPYDPVEIYARPHPGHHDLMLLRITRGAGVKNGPWYLRDHAVMHGDSIYRYRSLDERLDVNALNNDAIVYLNGCLWADWQANGDLLYADEGRMLRHSLSRRHKAGIILSASPSELADFTQNTFEPIAPPPEATRW